MLSTWVDRCWAPSAAHVCDPAPVLGIANSCLLKEARVGGGHHPQAWMWLLALKAR